MDAQQLFNEARWGRPRQFIEVPARSKERSCVPGRIRGVRATVARAVAARCRAVHTGCCESAVATIARLSARPCAGAGRRGPSDPHFAHTEHPGYHSDGVQHAVDYLVGAPDLRERLADGLAEDHDTYRKVYDKALQYALGHAPQCPNVPSLEIFLAGPLATLQTALIEFERARDLCDLWSGDARGRPPRARQEGEDRVTVLRHRLRSWCRDQRGMERQVEEQL